MRTLVEGVENERDEDRYNSRLFCRAYGADRRRSGLLEPPEEDEINIEGISIGDDELGDVALESINESPDMYDALTRLVGEVIGEYEAEMEPDL